MIRVSIVAPGPKSEGGIRSVVERILPLLGAETDIRVHWIASHRQGSLPAKVACFLGAFARALWLFPRSSIVHVHGTVGLSLFRKSAFVWLAKAFNCRVIYHFHSTVTVFDRFFSKKGASTAFALATLRRCDVVVVLSDTWKKIVEKTLPDSRIEVIYNPVLDTAGGTDPRERNSGRVLYLAHLIERKGYQDLIAAFAGVVEQVADARLVFCGSGEEAKARALCEELGIEDAVEFHGWVGDDAKADELRKASVFCLPSYDEGLPMGVLEAMSSGVPIVTTPVGGVPDVLTDEVSALLFEPGDVAGLRDRLTRLLQDGDLRVELASRAVSDSRRFRPREIADAWVRLYRKLVPDRGRPGKR